MTTAAMGPPHQRSTRRSVSLLPRAERLLRPSSFAFPPQWLIHPGPPPQAAASLPKINNELGPIYIVFDINGDYRHHSSSYPSLDLTTTLTQVALHRPQLIVGLEALFEYGLVLLLSSHSKKVGNTSVLYGPQQ